VHQEDKAKVRNVKVIPNDFTTTTTSWH